MCPGHPSPASPRRAGSQGTRRDPAPSFPRCRPAWGSRLFSREETGNLAILFFFLLFLFFFSPCACVWGGGGQAGGQWCRVPAGARCRRGDAGGARRPRGDNAGDGPRRSRPYCVSEEEMDEGHILPLFRCPAPGKSCAL